MTPLVISKTTLRRGTTNLGDPEVTRRLILSGSTWLKLSNLAEKQWFSSRNNLAWFGMRIMRICIRWQFTSMLLHIRTRKKKISKHSHVYDCIWLCMNLDSFWLSDEAWAGHVLYEEPEKKQRVPRLNLRGDSIFFEGFGDCRCLGFENKTWTPKKHQRNASQAVKFQLNFVNLLFEGWFILESHRMDRIAPGISKMTRVYGAEWCWAPDASWCHGPRRS